MNEENFKGGKRGWGTVAKTIVRLKNKNVRELRSDGLDFPGKE